MTELTAKNSLQERLHPPHPRRERAIPAQPSQPLLLPLLLKLRPGNLSAELAGITTLPPSCPCRQSYLAPGASSFLKPCKSNSQMCHTLGTPSKIHDQNSISRDKSVSASWSEWTTWCAQGGCVTLTRQDCLLHSVEVQRAQSTPHRPLTLQLHLSALD